VNIFQEIRDRRVIPAVGVYVGGSWVIVEILDRLVERYLLSPYVTDIAFWGLYSLLPAVILVAWTHGRPGKDQSTTVEKVGVPINIIATLGLIITVFGGKDLGATANLVTINNELGQQEQHYIPRESYRRRMAVFFWDNESGDAELDWLQYGVTALLVQDLQQNPFMLANSPWNNMSNGFYARMKQAGFDDGLDLPVSLMQEIAEWANRQYFVEGDIARAGQDYVVTARVWETESLNQLGEVVETGWELMPVMDRVSEGIRTVLDVPSGKGRLAEDLPLTETYGESTEAFKNYISGLNALLFDNDYQAAGALLDKALEADPEFVLAWFLKGMNQVEQGDIPAAQESFARAQKLDYRLPGRDQATLKGLMYRLSGDQEKLETFLRLQVQLQGDAAAQRHLANFLMLTGRLEEAKKEFKLAMQKDEMDLGVYLHLSNLERATGDQNAAISYARKYHEARPENVNGMINLGNLLLDAGDMEGARAHYEKAQFLESQPLTATLSLALLAFRQGEWPQVRELIEEARTVAVTPAQRSRVLQVEGLLEFRLGRISRAIDLLERQAEQDRQSVAPLDQVIMYTIPLVEYRRLTGNLTAAETAIASALEVLQPPLDQFIAFSEASVLAGQGEPQLAEAALLEGREIIDRFKADYLQYLVPMTEAEIAASNEDWLAAARSYERAIEDAERSIFSDMVRQQLSVMYGACAEYHVRAGELDLAQKVLDSAFRRDPSEPTLWFAKALLQQARGSRQMAAASLNYALAIWDEADPEYINHAAALELRDELAQ
jgi:tetratricopeptide (TPR) repeat protein